METCCIYTEAKNRSCSPAHSDLSGMCPVRIPEKITTPLPLSSQPHENNQITFKTPPFYLSEQRTYALSVSAPLQKTKYLEREQSNCLPKPQPSGRRGRRTESACLGRKVPQVSPAAA